MPRGGILTDDWRDIFNIVSLAAGGISLVVSLVGLVYSVLSWKAASKAKTAAEAAREAAEQARNESLRKFEAYAAGKLRDYIHQAFDYLHRCEWGKAALLLREVGEQVGHFAIQDGTWLQSADDLRQMATSCVEWEANGRKRRHPKKWNLLLNELLAKLPIYHSPI